MLVDKDEFREYVVLTCLKDEKAQRSAEAPRPTPRPHDRGLSSEGGGRPGKAPGRGAHGALGAQPGSASASPRPALPRVGAAAGLAGGRARRGQRSPAVQRSEVGGAVAVAVSLIGAGRRGGMFNS